MRRDMNLLLFTFRNNFPIRRCNLRLRDRLKKHLKARKQIDSPIGWLLQRLRRQYQHFVMSHGTLLVLEPLRQTNADPKSANEFLVLIREIGFGILLPFFDGN